MLMPVRFRHGLSPESFGNPSRQAHAFTPPCFDLTLHMGFLFLRRVLTSHVSTILTAGPLPG